MKDGFGREISYMRISITEQCNLRCTYCRGMLEPVGEMAGHIADSHLLSPERIAEIVAAAAALGIEKIRVTGGEPLLRPDVVEICRRIHEVPGIRELTLTTNGLLLERYAKALKEAGVGRVNISLDTLKADKYRDITGGGLLSLVLSGIEAAKNAELFPIKINVVLLRGFNEEEIPDFVNMTREAPIEVRFIEHMPVGNTLGGQEASYLPGEAVLEAVPQLLQTEERGVATLYQLPDGIGRVGLIRPVSRHFCPSCNRIRLTCDGYIKPCLHSEEEIDTGRLHGLELEKKLQSAISKKPMEHGALNGEHGSRTKRSMHQIGG